MPLVVLLLVVVVVVELGVVRVLAICGRFATQVALLATDQDGLAIESGIVGAMCPYCRANNEWVRYAKTTQLKHM